MKRLLLLFLFVPIALFSQRYVSGYIVDAEDKEPIAGVTVFISNTTVGTTTDADGHYRLKIPSAGSYELTISHVAYQSVVKLIEAGFASVEYNMALQTHELYNVSLVKFIRSLYHNTLHADGFVLATLRSNADPAKTRAADTNNNVITVEVENRQRETYVTDK